MKLFYTWLLPAVWLPVTIVSFYNSGDEHSCYAFATFPFTILIVYLFHLKTLSSYFFATLPLAIIILVPLGWAMDTLRVNRIGVLLLFLIGTVALFWAASKNFESFQDMQDKHGSVLAVFATSANISLYCTIIAGILATFVVRLILLLKAKNYVGINSSQQA